MVVLVCSSGPGIRDPGFRGPKCLRTHTGLLGLIFVSSFLPPEGKLTGSRFSGSWPSVTGYTNSGISGGESEGGRTKGVRSRGGSGYALLPVGATGGLKTCKMDQAATRLGVILWYTPLPPSPCTPFITRLHSFLMPLDEHKSLAMWTYMLLTRTQPQVILLT